jgi:ATP-dependent DNA ligase
MIGSLLVGLSTPDGLAYIGNVGTGFTDAALRDLLGRLTALETPTSPFDAVPVPDEFARLARWVRPELGGEVAYAEIGLEGRRTVRRGDLGESMLAVNADRGALLIAGLRPLRPYAVAAGVLNEPCSSATATSEPPASGTT